MQTSLTIREQVEANQQRRYRDYAEWATQRLERSPIIWTTDLLRFDLRNHGEISAETWARFDKDETTHLAEAIQTKHAFVDRYRFDHQRDQVIVTEGDGFRPDTTLDGIIEIGYKKSTMDAAEDPRLTDFVRRDEIFMQRHAQVKATMRGETAGDTIVSFSTYPEELEQLAGGLDILKTKACQPDRRVAFMYVDRKVGDDQLESAIYTIDNSRLAAFGMVLGQNGHLDVPFAMLNSHEYGRYMIQTTTAGQRIGDVGNTYIEQYDDAMHELTGKVHNQGRREESVDAHEFLAKHQDWWAVYKAYNEQLARALNGEPTHPQLVQYLQKSLDEYQQAGASTLDASQTAQLQNCLAKGRIDLSIEVSAKKVLRYANGALFKELFTAYAQTGVAQRLNQSDGGSLMSTYADEASGSGGRMAARGESMDGCDLSISVETARSAAEMAEKMGISIDQAARLMEQKRDEAYKLERRGNCRICYPMPRGKNTWVGGCSMCGECVKVWERGYARGGDRGGEKALQVVQKSAANFAGYRSVFHELVESVLAGQAKQQR